MKRVPSVDHLDEFGAAEACWHFEVEDFPGIVAMDSHGTSLFESVRESSKKKLKAIFEKDSCR